MEQYSNMTINTILLCQILNFYNVNCSQSIKEQIQGNRYTISRFSLKNLQEVHVDEKQKIQIYFGRDSWLELKGLCNELKFRILVLNELAFRLKGDYSVDSWCGIHIALMEAIITRFLPTVNIQQLDGNEISFIAPNGEFIFMNQNKNKTFD